MVVPADLQWQIIRKNNCYLRKQRGLKKPFTTEPFNLKGIHSFRHCGLIKRKAIDIEPAADGKGVVMIKKKLKHQRRPNSSSTKIVLYHGSRKAFSSIESIMRKGQYRPGDTWTAVRKASRLLQSQKPKTPRKVRQRRKQRAVE